MKGAGRGHLAHAPHPGALGRKKEKQTTKTTTLRGKEKREGKETGKGVGRGRLAPHPPDLS